MPAAYIREVVAAELMGAGNVDDQMPMPPMFASLMMRSSQPVLTKGLLTDGVLWRCVERPASWHICCLASRIVSRPSFVLPVRFLQVSHRCRDVHDYTARIAERRI